MVASVMLPAGLRRLLWLRWPGAGLRCSGGRPAAAGEFVDDDDFAVFGDDIIFVALEQRLGPQRLLQVVNGADVFGAVQVVDAEDFFDFFDAGVGQDDVLRFSSVS
jgi:hypothetical protein